MPERSQTLHESVANLKVEGSWSRMASMGETGSIEMALQVHENIRGSETSDGVHCCIQAGTALCVDNYLDNLWVHRTPLPMGLHCQNPLTLGVKLPKKPLAAVTNAASSMLPGGTFHVKGPTNPTALQMKRVKSKCCCLIQ